MRILIDTGHPAHVHMFSRFAQVMQQRGHEVLFTCRDKEFEKLLLANYGLQFYCLGKKQKSFIKKLIYQFLFVWRERKIAKQFKPDVFVSHGSLIAAQTAHLLHIPHITFEDTFNMEQVKLYIPITQAILTATYENPIESDNAIRFQGYNELLYLHPNRFTPDEGILSELGVLSNDGVACTKSGTHYTPYVIIRFVSWNATHDAGHKGISLENKIRAVHEFSKYARVFISSERDLPTELQSYKSPINPFRMHHAQAFASLIFGESATMVSEGVVLGVPGIYLDNTGRLYTAEQERDYQMCYNFTESEEDQEKAIQRGVDILKDASSSKIYASRQKQLLADKIDVTAWLMWFIENYPSSAKEAKENKDNQEFWKRFK